MTSSVESTVARSFCKIAYRPYFVNTNNYILLCFLKLPVGKEGHNSPGAESLGAQQRRKYFLHCGKFTPKRHRTWGRQTCFLSRAPSNLDAPLPVDPTQGPLQHHFPKKTFYETIFHIFYIKLIYSIHAEYICTPSSSKYYLHK